MPDLQPIRDFIRGQDTIVAHMSMLLSDARGALHEADDFAAELNHRSTYGKHLVLDEPTSALKVELARRRARAKLALCQYADEARKLHEGMAEFSQPAEVTEPDAQLRAA